jgi:hypothetical protein
MIGLGKWASAVEAVQSARLKARKKILSQGKSLLSTKEQVSSSGESAAVRFAQSSLLSFGDGAKGSDNDPAVVSTVETLSVIGSDTPIITQEKEARTTGGTPSQ